MKKSIIIGSSLLLLIAILTGCNNNSNVSSKEDAVSSTELTVTTEVQEETEEGNDEIARIEDTVVGNKAEDLGLNKGYVVSEDNDGVKQVTGISFYGIRGISQYETDDKGNITTYTLYAENIADDFESTVDKAVKGMEKETGETAVYEEVEVNEGKNGMTTIEALKKGNLYCNYTFTDKGTYIQITGDGTGNISMLIKIGAAVEETNVDISEDEIKSDVVTNISTEDVE